MQTKEIYNNYRTIISKLLQCSLTDIKIERRLDDNIWYEIDSICYDKEKIDVDFKLGAYRLMILKNNQYVTVSSWNLYQLQHCCAFMVSCNVTVAPDYRNKKIGTVLNKLRQDIGKLLEYSAVICTDIEQNINQRKLLKTNGWKDIHSIINKRTQNRVYLSVINI